MKYIFTIMCFMLLFSGCNSDSQLSKKVPGWYSYEQVVEKGTVIGKLTYYKNGALKLVANVKGEVAKNLNVGISLTLTGTWKVEKGYLKEEIVECKSTPQFIGDALLSEYKKTSQTSPGDKIIDVNKKELRVKKPNGEIVTYKRLQK